MAELTDMQIAKRMFAKKTGYALRREWAVKFITSGMSGKEAQAEMLRRFGMSIGQMELHAIEKEIRGAKEIALSAPALLPPVVTAGTLNAIIDRLDELTRLVTETHAQERKNFGHISALRYEVNRIADALGAPKQTAAMTEMRAKLPQAPGESSGEGSAA